MTAQPNDAKSMEFAILNSKYLTVYRSRFTVDLRLSDLQTFYFRLSDLRLSDLQTFRL